MSEKTLIDRIVLADEQGHLQGKPLESVRGAVAEAVQQQITEAMAPLEKIPEGGAPGEVLARTNHNGTQLEWRQVRDGRDGLDGRAISRIEPTPEGTSVNVVMSDGSATEVPVKVISNWSLAAQAKAQGYIIITGDEPPAEDTMFGVPVYWMRGAGPMPPTPVQAPMPSTNFLKRIITIPDRVGVRYTVDGSPVPAGDYNVPGTDRKTVEIMAHAANAKFVLPGTYRWMRTFGSLSGRPLVASDVFTTRTAGDVLVPPVSPENYGKFQDRLRSGTAWNNAAGGSRPVSWGQSGNGVVNINGTDTLTSWVVTENGTIINREWRLEGALVFQSVTPNISVEVDIAAVRRNCTFTVEFGQPRPFNGSRGRPSEIWLTPTKASVRDRSADGQFSAPLNAGAPQGKWRFDFLDGVITITSPSGIQAVQAGPEMKTTDRGQWSKIWVSEREGVEISAIRIFRHPAE